MKNMESRVTIAVPPGETIKEILEHRGIKQKEAKTENETAEKTNNTKKIETDQGKMVLDLFDGKYVE